MPGRGSADSAGFVHGPVPVASASLPAVPAGFTGRAEDLARLMPVLDPSSDSDLPVVICAVSGLGGIGKTSLAMYAGHKAVKEGWFPGGTLFVDFRGYDENPVTADQAVLALLDKLGVQGRNLPTATPEQYVLYRDLLAERRDPMLLVLDNARTVAQIAPLIPGTDRHRVLITSRDRLAELDARLLDLDALKPKDAADLIDKSLRISDERDDRVVHEPEAVAALARLCGHHPLCLQVAAGLLRKGRYRTIESMVGQLGNIEDRTAVLGVRPILEAAYGQLASDQARLLRLLCGAPTAEVSDEAAVALSGLNAGRTLALLEELAASRLITPVPVDEGLRWRLHDLVRAFGAGVVAEKARRTAEGNRARERLLGFYCRWAYAANIRLRWLPGSEEPERFVTWAQALAWLDAERAGLVAAVQWAHEKRFSAAAVRLALILSEYLGWRRFSDDEISVARVAQQVAIRTDDPAAEAAAWTNLGCAWIRTGQLELAIDAHTRARDLCQSLGDRLNEANSWNNLSFALGQAGHVEESIHASTHALHQFQSLRDRQNEAHAWNNVGCALQKAGRLDEAVDAQIRARDLYQALQDRQNEATAWTHLGLALKEAGRVKEAISAYCAALDIYREFEHWYHLGETLKYLAHAHQSIQGSAQARVCWLQATQAFTRANAPTEAAEAQAAADALT